MKLALLFVALGTVLVILVRGPHRVFARTLDEALAAELARVGVR